MPSEHRAAGGDRRSARSDRSTEPSPGIPRSDPPALERAFPADIPALLDLHDTAARWLAARGIDQWNPGDFPTEKLADNIGKGTLWVCRREERLAGTVTTLWEDPAVWGDEAGNDGRAGYVWFLVADRRHRIPGLGSLMLGWAEEQMLQRGRQVSRLDCVASNPALRAYYEAAGYRPAGLATFAAGHRRAVARYEKRLSRASASRPNPRPEPG